MSTKYKVAIVGSGPAGISAATRAAEMGDSHILLEAKPHLSNTIYSYQKRKHVMAEPAALPLRAACRFQAGRREEVLGAWEEDVRQRKVNLRLHAQIIEVIRDTGGFQIKLADGESVLAENVVMAIGVQGNLRKLGCQGDDFDRVQYQLDDPDAFSGEVIVVVGAGDAAIENAIALADQNEVHIVNRKGEFSRAKDGNNISVLQAIESGRVRCHYHASPERVVSNKSGRPLTLILDSKEGALEIACDRVIGRLGATPPREFLERCGIKFTGTDPGSLPAISSQYESSLPGLYIVGALAGNPLIKQAMNQGYEVIERIMRRPVVPADEPLILQKLRPLGCGQDVAAALQRLRDGLPVFSALSVLQLREFLLESEVHVVKGGEVIYEAGSFGTSIYAILQGAIGVQLDPTGLSEMKLLTAGRIFGEMALISGRPRAAAVVAIEDALLIEVPRRSMLKLMATSKPVKEYLDRIFAERAIQSFIAPEADEEILAAVVAEAKHCTFKANQEIYAPTSAADSIHLIRSGSVMIGSLIDGKPSVESYLAAGQYFGEEDVIAGTARTQFAQAAVKTETISVPADQFRRLLDAHPHIREAVRKRFRDRIRQRQELAKNPDRGQQMRFLLDVGLGEATDALIIDETLCVQCDQCETACAATHGDVSRLDRDAGTTFGGLNVPTSCRHCEHPHCMKDCPPNAIHRSGSGEVYIEDTCIGCGNCERNCPYGVIQMGSPVDSQPSLWKWLLFGEELRPAKAHESPDKSAPKKAVKCDMCRDRPAGPACVQACPTGAALRVGPEEFFSILSRGQ